MFQEIKDSLRRACVEDPRLWLVDFRGTACWAWARRSVKVGHA